MATQWSSQSQQAQQYQQAPRYQQPPQFQPPQQYQQPQYQQAHQYPVQYPQLPPQQYQQPTQQYPQPQPYQQQGQYTQGQYTQGQQYPQAGQYSQAQPYQQQPQQYPQTQQHGYNVWQQQYTPQQYNSQQYTPQQQITTQHVAYQQPYQQQASPTNAQTPTPVKSDACYNCGNPSHFAQDCPEPKRALPAGALNPRKFSNSFKRPKAGVEVVSQSSPAPPTSGAQVQGYPQGYPPSIHNGHPERHVHDSPATPTSAQSSAQHQAWQQYWQWQAYQQQQQQQQQQYQQQQGQQQGSPYSQQPYAVPLNQAVGPNDHYQPPSQAQTQASHNNSSVQIYQGQHPQAQNSQTPTATAVPAHYDLHPRSNTTDEPSTHQRQLSLSSIFMQSQCTLTSASKKEDATEEIEEVDLGLLDIPDLPTNVSKHGENIHLPNTIVSPPVSLIGMPLPANFVVADALYPIAPPAPETEGRCQSKYLRDVTSDVLCENIQVSKYWKDHKDDTAFFDIPDADNVVSINEIRAQLKERRISGEANDESTRQTRSESRSSIALRKDSVDARSRLEQLELEKAETLAKIAAKEKQRALKRGEQVSPPPFAAGGTPNDGQTIVKEEQVTAAPSAMSGKAVTDQNNTEDLLAALGVTGAPKPVTATNGAYNGFMHKQPNGSRPSPVRQLGDLQNIGTLSYSPDYGPPPPPPPLTWQQSFSNRADGSPSSAVPGSMNGHAFSTNGAELDNGYYNSGTDAELLSPNAAPYSQSSIRKRSYNRRDSSSSDGDSPARRQEDEVTPKLKRRQPKVAAAYR